MLDVVDDLGEEVGHLLLRLVEYVVEVARNIAILVVEERDGLTGVAGAARAADAMHVLVDVGGQVEVDDELDVGDVETARRHRRGDQDGPAGAAEGAQRLLALRLALVAVYADGRIVLVLQVALELVGAALRLHKDERQRVRIGAQQVDEKRALLVLLDPLEALRDHHGRAAHASHRQEDVVVEEVARQHLYLLGKGGREHHGLTQADAGHVASLDNVAYLRLEAHVEHAVGLVQHQVGDVLEADLAALVQVDEAAGRGHQYVAAHVQVAHLVLDVGAAVDDARTDARPIGELARLLVDLERELAGGREHERLGQELLALVDEHVVGDVALAEDQIEDGHEEGGRLARARLSARHQVAAVGDDRHGVLLHRRRLRVLAQLDVVGDDLVEVELLELETNERTNSQRPGGKEG